MKAYYFIFYEAHPLRHKAQRVWAETEAWAEDAMDTFYGSKWWKKFGPFETIDYQSRVVELNARQYTLTDYDIRQGQPFTGF